MTETEYRPATRKHRQESRSRWRGGAPRWWRSLGRFGFSSLTRRIVFLNLVALVLLLAGILYSNQSRESLIDARVQSLLTQGEIIAAAIAAQASVDLDQITIDPSWLLELEAGESLSPLENSLNSLEFPINPERAAPILRRLILPTRTRARIYDDHGQLILDSRALYARGDILRYDLRPLAGEKPGLITQVWQNILLWVRRGDLPLYRDLGPDEGKEYPEVSSALTGAKGSVVRVNDKGELVVSVAVPVRRFRAVLGVLLLSTQGGDIDAVLTAERLNYATVFLVAVAVTMILSLLLASTIAEPMRRLAAAADRVRHSIKEREKIPNFSARGDEIGHLSASLADMTNALYSRIEGIERFAADVAHELKNPLTSLRSAVETLPLAKDDDARARLIAIAQHDVRRLDRLISDISAASRLDAELARDDAERVDLVALLETIIAVSNDTRGEEGANIVLQIEPAQAPDKFYLLGHGGRLAQIFTNLLDNAQSLSPSDSVITVDARREAQWIHVRVIDQGPGIASDNVEIIFSRFYTDRPSTEGFGNHSGLGLSISQQIAEGHGGKIWAENGEMGGAVFHVYLPAEA